MATALSGTDTTNLRAGNHVSKAWLALAPTTSIGTARINQTTFTNPIAQLTIDGTSANWTTKVKKGMDVWIGTTAGARDVGVYRIRKTPTTSILYLGEFSNGDSGMLPLASLNPLADNQYITVMNHYGLHPIMSRIVFSGGTATFYKDYDIAYADYNEVAETPVQVNIGNHYAGFVNTGTSKITVSFAVSVKAFGSGVTASSYLWAVDDGTITVGSTTSSSITATFPKGFRWVTCAVTLSNGTVVNVQRAVWAFNTTDTLPYEVEITSDTRTPRGRTLTFNLPETTISTANIDDGVIGMLFTSDTWNGASISTATSQMVGFLRRATTSSMAMAQMGKGDYTLESPLLVYEQMPFVSQQLTYSAAPANWTEVDGTLNHTEYYSFYLLYWHTTLLNLFDFYPNAGYDSYKFQAFSSSGGSIIRALEENLKRLNMNIGQASNGSIYIYRDPAYMTTSERSAMITRMTITDDDITNLSFDKVLRSQVSQVHVYGASWSGGTVSARLVYGMGTSRGYGSIEETLEGQLLGTTAPETELRERGSNHFAKLNNPHPRITAEFIGNYDVFELPDIASVTFSISAAYAPNGTAYTQSAYPIEVNTAWLPSGVKRVTATFSEITSGLAAPATTMPIIVGNGYPPSEIPIPPYNDDGEIEIPYDPYIPPPVIVGDDDVVIDTDEEDAGNIRRVVFAWSDTKIARMFPELGAEWELLWENDEANADIFDVLIDSFSSILTADPDAGTLDLYVASRDDGPAINPIDGVMNLEDVLGFTLTEDRLDDLFFSVLRQRGYAVTSFSGTRYELPLDKFGVSSSLTGTLLANSATAVLVSHGTSVGGRMMLTTEGTIQWGSAGEEVDGAYYTTDGWVTYHRHNTLKIGGVFVRPTIIEYNTDHYYGWGFRKNSGENLSVEYIDPSGAYSGTGTITLKNFLLGHGDFRIRSTSDDFANYFVVNSTTNSLNDHAIEPDYTFDTCDFTDFLIYNTMDKLKYVTDLSADSTGTVIPDIGLTVSNQRFTPNLIRIPYRQIDASRAPNDDPDAMHFIYGMNGEVTSGYLFKGVINDGAASATETDITPVVSGVTYMPIGRHSVETSGNDSRVMLGFFENKTGEDGSVLLYTSNGGTNWTLRSAVSGGDFVHWETKNAVWFCGTDHNSADGMGIGFSPDRGVTFEDMTSNWNDVIGEFPIKGVRVVRF